MIFGCSFLTPPKEKPVIQDYVGTSIIGEKTTHVFSLTPERRTVIVIPSKIKSQETGKIEKTVKFCAEPPPDVAESLADTFRFIAEAQLKKPDIGAGVEFYRAFTSTAMKLFYRSQGIQLFRDGMYNICQAYMNGVIEEQEYVEIYNDLVEKTRELIALEIPKVEQGNLEEAINQANAAANLATGARDEVTVMEQVIETNLNKVVENKNAVDTATGEIRTEIEALKVRVERLEQ